MIMFCAQLLSLFLLVVAGALAEENPDVIKPPKPPCPKICTANYEPYCGTDGITYSNKCELNIAMCKNESLKQQHKGPCIQHVKCDKGCTREYMPHCGSDGKTYGNKCMFEIAVCKNPKLKLLYERECKTREGFCPKNRQGDCTQMQRCTADQDCSKDEKCCKTKCWQSCVKACKTENSICKSCPKGQKAVLKPDKDGCLVCRCVKHCRPRFCSPCRFGYVKDSSGCPTCDCQPAPYCKIKHCRRTCFSRYVRDKYGCPKCKCRPRAPCPRVRCPSNCRPGHRRFVPSFTGCYICLCRG